VYKRFEQTLLEPDEEVRSVERAAVECLHRCRIELNLEDYPLPIPVDQWIEHPLGYGFAIEDLSPLGEGVLGAAFVGEEEIVISEKTLIHDGRFRFTCAHELGHMVLHADVTDVFAETSEITLASNDQYERQANRFAAAFLMPLPLVVQEMMAICDKYRLDRFAVVTQLLLSKAESVWLWKKRFLPELTRRFGVSLSTALFRFCELTIDGKPILNASLYEQLLKPAADNGMLNDIVVEQGVPRLRRQQPIR